MLSRFLRTLSVLVISFGVCSSSAFADIIIDNFTDATNDRFTNDSAFIGNPYDFSGLGRTGGWATMISSNVGLSAAHSHPAVDTMVRFYPGNDSTAKFLERRVIGGQRVGSSDLYAVIFDSPLPNSIKVYDFATENLSGTGDAGSFQNQLAFMVGISPTAHSNAAIDQAVGQNRITGYLEDADFLGNTDNDAIILEYNDSGDSDYTTFESKLVSGDSGAPMFVVRDGDLLLLGVNSFVFDSPFSGSGITYTGNLTSELNAIILANAVPEPGGFVFMGLCCLGVMGRRRRRR